MTTILLVRHGHVDGIVPKRFRGQLDIPLSTEGREQARQAAQFLAVRYAPQAVYTSPLQRCRDSAAALCARLALSAPVDAPGVLDIHYGSWQGRLAAEIAAEQPAGYAIWQQSPQDFSFPGGESLSIVAARASVEIAALAERHRGQCMAIYSHDSVIRTLLLRALAAPFAAYHRITIDPCSLSELCYEPPGTFELVRVNERTRWPSG